MHIALHERGGGVGGIVVWCFTCRKKAPFWETKQRVPAIFNLAINSLVVVLEEAKCYNTALNALYDDLAKKNLEQPSNGDSGRTRVCASGRARKRDGFVGVSRLISSVVTRKTGKRDSEGEAFYPSQTPWVGL